MVFHPELSYSEQKQAGNLEFNPASIETLMDLKLLERLLKGLYLPMGEKWREPGFLVLCTRLEESGCFTWFSSFLSCH